jgi:hypothetical protein
VAEKLPSKSKVLKPYTTKNFYFPKDNTLISKHETKQKKCGIEENNKKGIYLKHKTLITSLSI